MAAYEEKFYLADTTVPKASLKDYHWLVLFIKVLNYYFYLYI